MSKHKELNRILKRVSWTDEFHDVLGYQGSYFHMLPKLLSDHQKMRAEPVTAGGEAGPTGKPKKVPKPPKELKDDYVARVRGWEQTHNAYLNMILRLLPSKILGDVFGLRTAAGEVELTDFIAGLPKSTGLDKNTLQIDSMLLSDDTVCMIEIKTNDNTHFTLQQVVKYLHGISAAGRERSCHKLFLVSNDLDSARWQDADISLLVRGRDELAGPFTLASLGITIDDVRTHLKGLTGKQGENASKARWLLNRFGDGIEQEFHSSVIEWLDWDTLLKRLNFSVEELPEGDLRLMCRRLAGDFSDWRDHMRTASRDRGS